MGARRETEQAAARTLSASCSSSCWRDATLHATSLYDLQEPPNLRRHPNVTAPARIANKLTVVRLSLVHLLLCFAIHTMAHHTAHMAMQHTEFERPPWSHQEFEGRASP